MTGITSERASDPPSEFSSSFTDETAISAMLKGGKSIAFNHENCMSDQYPILL